MWVLIGILVLSSLFKLHQISTTLSSRILLRRESNAYKMRAALPRRSALLEIGAGIHRRCRAPCSCCTLSCLTRWKILNAGIGPHPAAMVVAGVFRRIVCFGIYASLLPDALQPGCLAVGAASGLVCRFVVPAHKPISNGGYYSTMSQIRFRCSHSAAHWGAGEKMGYTAVPLVHATPCSRHCLFWAPER